MYIKPIFLFFVYILDFHIQLVFLYFMRLYVWLFVSQPCNEQVTGCTLPLPSISWDGLQPLCDPLSNKAVEWVNFYCSPKSLCQKTLEMMGNPTIVLQNEGVLCLLSWLILFGYDNWLYNSSIRNAPQRLIQYLIHPVDHYHTFYYVCFGGYSVWFWWALNHLHLPQRKRFQPLRENDFSCWVIFQYFRKAFNCMPRFVFLSSAMCKNVILPYHDPNMQPFIQQLPVFICSASVRLSASCHEYLKWDPVWLNTGNNSLPFLFFLWKLLTDSTCVQAPPHTPSSGA